MTPYSLCQPQDVCCPSDTACRNTEHDTSSAYVTAPANATPETGISACFDAAEDERPCYTQHDGSLESDALNDCECLDVHGGWIRVNTKDKLQYSQEATYSENRYPRHESKYRQIERHIDYFDDDVPICSGSTLNSGEFVTKEYYVMGGVMKSCLMVGEDKEADECRAEWYHGGGDLSQGRGHAVEFHCDRTSRSTSVGLETWLQESDHDGAGLHIYDGVDPTGNGCSEKGVVGSREVKIYTDLDHPSRSENDIYNENDDVYTRNDDVHNRNSDIYRNRNEGVFRAHYRSRVTTDSLNGANSYYELGGQREDRYYTNLDSVYGGLKTGLNPQRKRESASSVDPSSWGQENFATGTFHCSRENITYSKSTSGFKRADSLSPEWIKEETRSQQKLACSKVMLADEAKRKLDHADIYRSATYIAEPARREDENYMNPDNPPGKRKKCIPQLDNNDTGLDGQCEKYCFTNHTGPENIIDKSAGSSESHNNIQEQCTSEKDKVGSLKDETKPRDNANSNTILPPCRICGAKASGFHYGVNSCEACKGFFRRALKRPMVFHCTKDKTCDVKGNKRSSCRFCRFKRCLKLGMSKEAIKTGRYSHKKRTRDTIEVKMLQKEEPVVADEQDVNAILEAIFSADDTQMKSSAAISDNDLIGRQMEYHKSYTARNGLVEVCTDNHCVKSDKNESLRYDVRTAISKKHLRKTRENEVSENLASKLNDHDYVPVLKRQHTLTNTPVVVRHNICDSPFIHPRRENIHKTNEDRPEANHCSSQFESYHQKGCLPKNFAQKKKVFVENCPQEEQLMCERENQTSRLNLTSIMGSKVRSSEATQVHEPRNDARRTGSAAGAWAPAESPQPTCTATTPATKSPTNDQSGVRSGENHEESKSAVIARAENWVMGYIGFARSLPGFSLLPSQDQANLLRHAWDEVWILEAHRGYNSDLEVATMPSGKCFHIDEMEIGWGKEYARLAFSMAEIIKRHNLSPELITMLKAVSIVSPDRCELKSRKVVENLHWTVVTYLLHYLEMKHHGDRLLLPNLISILTSLREISETARSGKDAGSADDIFASNMLTNMFAPF